MKTTLLLLTTALLVLPSCNNGGNEPDAMGNFEVTELTIASEVAGRILFIDAPEGRLVEKGSLLAVVDTTTMHLQKGELKAAAGSIRSKVAAITSQNEIIRQQIDNLNKNIARTEKMIGDNAATEKQLDDLNGQKAVFEKQIAANKTQAAAIMSEISVLSAKEQLLNEQITRCKVVAPASGTVLVRYSEAGEITSPGKPLLKIADLKTMRLKVYVSGAQLGQAQIGSTCNVRVDDGASGYRNYTGTITTVSEKAEFTPKIIQTKEERVTLVYAVTIEVENDGFIKSGMPGEANFSVTISN
jgi:HlyD family secretion protein